MGKNSRYLKALWLIPILILGYIGWVNLSPLGGTATYFIDVGGNDTSGKAWISGPFDRISGVMLANGTSFRELEAALVYFDLDSRKLGNADEVSVRVRFRDNFPGDARFVLGARDEEEWSYYWKAVYIPFYEQLAGLTVVAADGNTTVYATGEESRASFESVDEFLQNPPLGAVIARNNSDLSIDQRVSPQEWEEIDVGEFVTGDAFPIPLAGDVSDRGYLDIDTNLRGGHTLWAYVTGVSLELEVTKQDLNWYEGPDGMKIEVYSLNGDLRGNATIPDDGDVSAGAELGPLQSQRLSIPDLEPGAYKLELKGGGDLLIRRIEINQEKLVVDKRVYLAGMNTAYFKNGLPVDPVSLYFRTLRGSEAKFLTYHGQGLQRITIAGNESLKEVGIDETGEWFNATLEPGTYQLTAPRQDIVVEYDGYMAFTPDSFFLPKRSELLGLKYDLLWVEENVDYVVIYYGDYVAPMEDGGWLIAQATWKREDLFIKDNKLSFSFNVPYLAKPEEQDATIPIDWIEISLEIPPIWERLGD